MLRTGWRRAAAVASVALVAACGGASGAPEVPAGFVEKQVGSIVLAYPGDWREVPPPTEEVDLDLRAPGSDPAAVTGLRAFTGPTRNAVEATVDLFKTDYGRLPEFGVVDERPFDVDGAAEAALVEVTYRSGEGAAIRSFHLFARDDEGFGIHVQVAGPPMDRSTALRILRTVRFA